jgi:hypothetical protein
MSQNTNVTALRELKELLDEGVITQDDFEEKKVQLLDQLNATPDSAETNKPDSALRKVDLAAGRGLDLVLSIVFPLIGLTMALGLIYGCGILVDSGNRDFYAKAVKQGWTFMAGGIVLLKLLQASNR